MFPERFKNLLPWSLGTVRGDQNPASPEWVEATVRDVVQNRVRHCELEMYARVLEEQERAKESEKNWYWRSLFS